MIPEPQILCSEFKQEKLTGRINQINFPFLLKYKSFLAIRLKVSINISISEEKIKPVSANQVQATFIQEYRSDAFRDKTKKTLILEKESEGWKIVKEKSSINE